MNLRVNIFVLIASPLISHIICYFLDAPWWTFIFVSFLLSYGLLSKIFLQGFLLNFLSTFILWAFLSTYINYQNQSLLATKIAQLFHINSISILIFVIALFGGLLSGIAGSLGAYLRLLQKGK